MSVSQDLGPQHHPPAAAADSPPALLAASSPAASFPLDALAAAAAAWPFTRLGHI